MADRKKILSSIYNAIDSLRIVRHELPYKWCNKNHYLSPKVSNDSGRYESFPYAEEWLNWMVTGSVREITFKKSARITYTTSLVAAWCCLVVDRGRSCGIWRPNDTSRKNFVQVEIDPLFEYVPALSEKLVGGRNRNNPSNRNDFKEFTDSASYFLGAHSPSNFAGISIDVAIADEIDRWPKNIGKEGSSYSLMRKRTEQSVQPKIIAGSTPKIEGSSAIDDLYESADVKMERYLPCPHCKVKKPFWWQNFKFERGDDGRVTEAYFICQACGGKIKRSDYPEMDRNGVWMSEDGIIYDKEEDVFYDKDGGIIYEIKHLAVYIWAAYSYLIPWTQIADEFLEAVKSLREGDEDPMTSFVNTVRGLSYKPSAKKNQVSLTGLIGSVEDYKVTALPKGITFLTAGIDVQSGSNARLEIIVSGHSEDGRESWHVGHYVVNGEVENLTTCEDCNYIIFGTFHTEDNRRLRIKCALIDEGDGNNIDAVRRYANSLAHLEREKEPNMLIFRTYKGTDRGPFVHPYGHYGDRRHGTNVLCHHVNHITSKDLLFKAASEGRIHFNGDCNEEYFRQFTAEQRTVKRVNGELKVKYELKRPGIRCEVLDCWSMSRAAAEIFMKQKR